MLYIGNYVNTFNGVREIVKPSRIGSVNELIPRLGLNRFIGKGIAGPH
jgi:hypothetical protein